MLLKPVQRQLLECLYRESALTRAQLHRRTGVRPNTVGEAVDALLSRKLVRDSSEHRSGRGPQTPRVELDPTRRYVIGMVITPGRVEAGRYSLSGTPVSPSMNRKCAEPDRLVGAAAKLLRSMIDSSCEGVGFTIPGFIDLKMGVALHSSAFPGRRGVDLVPIFAAAGQTPIVLDSEVHAIGTHWLLSQRHSPDQESLVVSLHDGQVGASFIHQGKANAGCVLAGNELGHSQFPIDTARCYCGQTGCIERIFSSSYLRQITGSPNRRLEPALRALMRGDTTATPIVEAVSMALGNAVNLLRPSRLVLATTLAKGSGFTREVFDRVAGRVFPDIADRLDFEEWSEDGVATAQAAGYLALAYIFGLRESLSPVEK